MATAAAEAWREGAAAASTVHDVLVLLDVHAVPRLKSAGLTRDDVLTRMTVKKGELGTAWAEAAPKFGQFLQAMVTDTTPVDPAVRVGISALDATPTTAAKGDQGYDSDAGGAPVGAGAVGLGDNGKGPPDAVRGAGASPGSQPAAVSPFHAAVRPRLKALFLNTRNGQAIAFGGSCFVVWLILLIEAGVAMFEGDDKLYPYDSAACHCVVVNAYFGLFQALASVAMNNLVYMILAFQPDAGAFGQVEEDWTAEKKTKYINETLDAVAKYNGLYHAFFLAGSVTIGAFAIAFVGAVTFLVNYYVVYGFAFIVFMLGFCRIGCEDDKALSSASFPVDLFSGYYSSEVWSLSFDMPSFRDDPFVHVGKFIMFESVFFVLVMCAGHVWTYVQSARIIRASRHLSRTPRATVMVAPLVPLDAP